MKKSIAFILVATLYLSGVIALGSGGGGFHSTSMRPSMSSSRPMTSSHSMSRPMASSHSMSRPMASSHSMAKPMTSSHSISKPMTHMPTSRPPTHGAPLSLTKPKMPSLPIHTPKAPTHGAPLSSLRPKVPVTGITGKAPNHLPPARPPVPTSQKQNIPARPPAATNPKVNTPARPSVPTPPKVNTPITPVTTTPKVNTPATPVSAGQYPRYAQTDPTWAKSTLGNGKSTLGGSGCYVSSGASMLAGLGVKIDGKTPDPAVLNNWLKNNGGFAAGSSGLNRDAFSKLGVRYMGDQTSKDSIVKAMNSGQNVILRVPGSSPGKDHFVLANGVTSTGYNVVNPGSASKTHYSFDEVRSGRIYQKN